VAGNETAPLSGLVFLCLYIFTNVLLTRDKTARHRLW